MQTGDPAPVPLPRAGLAARVLAGGLLVAAFLAFLMLYLEHPAQRGVLPPCPTLWITRIYCPGCGALRTVHYTLQGDLAAAWRHNPLLLLIGPPLGAVLAVSLLSLVIRGRWCWPLPAQPKTRAIIGWVITLAVMAFGIARNLPGPLWEPLRPPPLRSAALPDHPP